MREEGRPDRKLLQQNREDSENMNYSDVYEDEEIVNLTEEAVAADVDLML